jgi:Tfp pilus assembly protein FimT
MRCAPPQRGFSVVELLAAIVVATALAFASVPPLVEIVRNSRLKAAARQIAGDLQQARARAVSTGWEYRLTGFGAAASGEYRNGYRMLARSSPLQDWPADSTPPSESATQLVGEWVEFDASYPGVAINEDDADRFAVTFDSRGVPVEKSLNFDPLQVSNKDGGARLVSVSAVGSVTLE